MPMTPPSLYPHFIRGHALLEEAYTMAYEAHAQMLRKVDGNPFINHPLRVGAALWRCGLDEAVVAAGFLHDTVEDTPLTIEEVCVRMGEDVATLVAALTEDKTISDYEERKAEHLQRLAESGARALAIFCADKLANLQDMLQDYEVEGEAMSEYFNGSIDQKEEHTREQIALLASAEGVNTLPIFKDFVATAETFHKARGHLRHVLTDEVFAS
jgi:(p)ppGpp synthase/HD superfamily hydrolase